MHRFGKEKKSPLVRIPCLSKQEFSRHLLCAEVGDTSAAEAIYDAVQADSELLDAEVEDPIFGLVHLNPAAVLAVDLVGRRPNPKKIERILPEKYLMTRPVHNVIKPF